MTVRGTYRPVAGDVDGDGRDDIIWYGPGAAGDSIWHFTSATVATTPGRSASTGNYRPVAGDLDGDHHADIVWNGGPAADYHWHFTGRTGSYVSTRRVLPEHGQAVDRRLQRGPS